MTLLAIPGERNVAQLRNVSYSTPQVDRIWGIWGSYYSIPKAIFYLLKGGLYIIPGPLIWFKVYSFMKLHWAPWVGSVTE